MPDSLNKLPFTIPTGLTAGPAAAHNESASGSIRVLGTIRAARCLVSMVVYEPATDLPGLEGKHAWVLMLSESVISA